MIISENNLTHHYAFNDLLNGTVAELNSIAKKSTKSLLHLAGNKLEPYIKDIMSEKAIGTPFENSIELVSGLKFPDIIAKKYFGVEVKSTTQNHWKTTGNSVLETTRIDGVERIFMLFGKLGKPVEFKCRPYEECLSEIVVTHSPRYLIDMNLEKGYTIFDKMQIEYDVLRKESNPIKPVVDYYKSKIKKGEGLWWMGNEGESSNIIIKIWNNLPETHRRILVIKAMAYFPELLSNSNSKYDRMAIWLVTKESVVCKNVRDLFTAGGKADIELNGKKFLNVPQSFKKVIDNLEIIKQILEETPAQELSEYWGKRVFENSKFKDWLFIATRMTKTISDASHIDFMQIALEKLKL